MHHSLPTPTNTASSGVFTAYGSCLIETATPLQVWQVLLDFSSYPSWNQYTTRVEPSSSIASTVVNGKPIVGEMYNLLYRPTTNVPASPVPIRIMQVDEEDYTVSWRGCPKFISASVLCPEKVQKVSKDEQGRTRFEVWETQAGPLAYVVKATLGKKLDGMNQGIADNLKEYVERQLEVAGA